MNCSQNSTPAAKKVPCISQMCTASLLAARSNSAGTCQATITTLNSATATQGRSRKPPAARSRRDQPATQDAPGHRLARAPRQPIQQRLPGRLSHHQGRRGEHQQQVLEHVHEEVVVGPVVDR